MSTDFSTIDVEQRAEQAVKNFQSGYNCCQSVYLAYADLFGISQAEAARTAAPFGAGMGRMREVCGTVSGMALIAGLAVPSEGPKDMASRNRCYALVQKVGESFRKENGSVVCRELLGISPMATPLPGKKRPCVELVRMSATMIGEELKEL